jgi:hypothetical protein
MRAFHEGQLVTLVGDGGEVDAIVVHVPSLVKVEVAIADEERGALFRMVHPKVLREREAPGEHDDTLRKRIRRSGSADRAGSRNGPRGGRRGHSSVAGHRTTGK